MAVKRCKANINVVTAAERRIINVFKNGLPVYMSFSGGKDSLCLSNLVLTLIQQGKINPAQLIVQFIDEEAIFPCIEKTVFEWRKKFLLAGAKFEWYCIEVKHFNCFNELSNDTHNRARGTHLLEPMKNIVKKLLDDGKTVEEIGKQLGMKPEEIFRLSPFTKDDFLEMMTKGTQGYSPAELITKY